MIEYFKDHLFMCVSKHYLIWSCDYGRIPHYLNKEASIS